MTNKSDLQDLKVVLENEIDINALDDSFYLALLDQILKAKEQEDKKKNEGK